MELKTYNNKNAELKVEELKKLPPKVNSHLKLHLIFR